MKLNFKTPIIFGVTALQVHSWNKQPLESDLEVWRSGTSNNNLEMCNDLKNLFWFLN